MLSTACGVDFGTSNSTVGWHRTGHPTLLPLEDGRPTLPSMVFFHTEEMRVSYGRAAMADYLDGYEGRLLRALKSVLGTSLMEGHTALMGGAMPFRTLLARFILELKRRAEASAGREFTRAVLGRPVHFVDDDPQADQKAQDTLAEVARDAGFADIAFQYEPLAAAFELESRMTEEALVLVADIGGGTSDFTLVRLGPQRAGRPDRRDDILAHSGVHIGGTDFDKQFSLARVMPMLGLGTRLSGGKDMPSTQYGNLAGWHTIPLAYTPKVWAQLSEIHSVAADKEKVGRLLELIRQRAGHWLALQVEEAKIALSGAQSARISLERIAAGLAVDTARSEFEQAAERLVDRIEDTVQALLRSACTPADDVDAVFFTGGSSSIPLLRSRLAARFPRARKLDGDLFGAIGIGLALDASRKFA